jgi:NAD(P)-dependent dehydrogenase (short-subunit alcohol dehydrogenase family)
MRKGTVLITGASTGIGQATALLLDRLGYRVFAGYRRQADAEALRAAGSMNLRPVRLDVTDPEDVQTAVAEVNEACGAAGLTALINNAGYTYVSAFECTEEAQARALMETNFFGLYRLSQACLPLLRRKVHHSGGTAKLINIGSVGSLIGIPWQAFYHASKFALLGLSESLQIETYQHGIRVSVVCPGGIKTPFVAKFGESARRALDRMPEPGRNLYGRGLTALSQMAGQVERLGSKPEAVARQVSRLMEKANPPFRLLVGPDAMLLNALRAGLPKPLFHAFLRSAFGG